MRASEPFEPSSICEQVRGSRLVLGRRFGRRFVFGRFWSLLGVVWGVVLFWSFLVAFGAIDAFSWRDRLAIEPT